MAALQPVLRLSSEYPGAEEVHCFASEKKSALENYQRQSQIVGDNRMAEAEEEGEFIRVPMCFTHRANNL